MTTIYEAEITFTIPWSSVESKTLEKAIKDVLEGLEVMRGTNRLENVDVTVNRTN